MWSKDFDGWNALKKRLDEADAGAFFAEREVWHCSIGVNVGREQDGHNDRFERPVLIVRGFDTNLFWGVPLSTKVKAANPYYFSYRHDGQMYAAIISQLRAFDGRRLVRKLYTMEPVTFRDIQMRLIKEIASGK